MSIEAIITVKGKGIPILGDDIDTDRIIPARYLKCVTFDGIGEFAFMDERFNQDGSKKVHPMNEEKYAKANIILSGNNFGCGSSREHAPQSIKRAGFDAVIAESFAEIFYGNSLTLGIVCITMPKSEIQKLAAAVAENSDADIVIDVESQQLTFQNVVYPFEIKDTSKKAFLEGTYDTLGELIKNIDLVKDFSKKLKYSFV